MDTLERAHERVDGLVWENSQHGASECACGHERDAHDTEGICQIRRCECERLTMGGNDSE